MATPDTDQAIRSRIDAFLAELGALVKRSALEAVQEALGGAAPRRRPGRRKGASHRGPGPRAVRPRRAGKRIRRSAEDLAKIGERVLAEVRSKPGRRLEEIGRALKTDTAVLKKPVADLLKAKKLKTTGAKRGTKYFLR
jgi:hypothetical protein